MNKIHYILLVAALNSFACFAQNYYINDNSTTGDIFCTAIGNNANDGLSPATPKASLENLLSTYGPSGNSTLTSGDIIYYDHGVYTTDHDLTLNVDGITIQGAGFGNTIIDNLFASADANMYMTITADNITISDLFLTEFNNSGGATVLHFSGAQNIVVNNVMANNNKPGGSSGAILIDGGSSVTFNGGGSSCNPGHPSLAGGGMSIEGGNNTVIINDYTFSNNYKDNENGGALYIVGNATTNVTVNNSNFDSNFNGTGYGGAVYISSGATININNTTFSENIVNQASATNYGGAIAVASGSTANIDHCIFLNNQAYPSGHGGSIAARGDFGSVGHATVNISNSSFEGGVGSSGVDLSGRGTSTEKAFFNITECTWSVSGTNLQDDDGDAVFSIANSGNPTTSGISSGEFVNTIAATVTPISNPPIYTDVCDYTLLPVELTSFTGKCTDFGNTLNWTTVSETNNAEFILEKSINNHDFNTIARITGAGTTQEAQNYRYNDQSLTTGVVYYRLSQVDFDGKVNTYSTIAVNGSCQNSSSEVFYSKTSHSIIYQSRDKGVELSLISTDGRLIQSKSFTNMNETHSMSIGQSLPTGIYLVQIVSGEKSVTHKVWICHE